MRKVIVSTVGTSLLTNQIERSHPAEKDWYSILTKNANLDFKETPPEALSIIETLRDRANHKLSSSSTSEIRKASAELNGIYGLYQEQLEQGKQDMHWLIATDTAQGKTTAKIVESYLQRKALTAQTYAPKGLSAANTRCFSEGIDDLLTQLNQMLEGYDRVCFNLVGGFKSFQAYLNTIGMFYADEIIYIFEGTNSELVTIPRLPIKIDESAVKPYAIQFALMAAGAEVSRAELPGIQETLIYDIDGEVTLSNWGKLIWNQVKLKLLSGDLLNFPKLQYQDSFGRDYAIITDNKEKIKLQETLAKISSLLIRSSQGISGLKRDGGIQMETYKNTNIDHFRVTLSLRVSCKVGEGDSLSLRYYGTHDHVERCEGI